MKLSSLYLIKESARIIYYDADEFDNDDLDPYDVANKVFEFFIQEAAANAEIAGRQ